jgi:hypothetical protein
MKEVNIVGMFSTSLQMTKEETHEQVKKINHLEAIA